MKRLIHVDENELLEYVKAGKEGGKVEKMVCYEVNGN